MGVLGNRSAAGFKQCRILPDIAAGGKAQASRQLAGFIGEDVTKDVARYDHFIFLRVFDQPHSGRVRIFLYRLNAVLLVLFANFKEDALHHSIRLADHIGLVAAVDFFTSVFLGVLKGGADDALAPLF